MVIVLPHRHTVLPSDFSRVISPEGSGDGSYRWDCRLKIQGAVGTSASSSGFSICSPKGLSIGNPLQKSRGERTEESKSLRGALAKSLPGCLQVFSRNLLETDAEREGEEFALFDRRRRRPAPRRVR